jgi:hypothetical protein
VLGLAAQEVAVSYVDPSGAQTWVYLMSHLLDLLRNVAWALVMAFATIGACWAGGAAATTAWSAIRRPAQRRDEPDPVEDEATRGIAEIETFLAARATPQRHRADDEADRGLDS